MENTNFNYEEGLNTLCNIIKETYNIESDSIEKINNNELHIMLIIGGVFYKDDDHKSTTFRYIYPISTERNLIYKSIYEQFFKWIIFGKDINEVREGYEIRSKSFKTLVEENTITDDNGERVYVKNKLKTSEYIPESLI